jgi:hypothetical protein
MSDARNILRLIVAAADESARCRRLLCAAHPDDARLAVLLCDVLQTEARLQSYWRQFHRHVCSDILRAE